MLAASVVATALLASHPATARLGAVLEFSPAASHHFNAEAPQKCDGARPELVTARLVRCEMKRPGRVPVTLSVCDDAKTFCRQESFEVTVEGALASSAAAPTLSAPQLSRRAPEGFIDNDAALAFAHAARERRLVLIDFYGIWCPPCNQLEEEAYPDPLFQKASAEFVRLGVDVDAASSFALKARYDVGGYPTLLIVDASGRELDRVVGYRSGPALARFLRGAQTPPTPLRLAKRRLEQGKLDEAEALLKPLDGPPARLTLLLLRRERARVKDDAAARAAAAHDLLREFPQEAAYIDWAGELADSDKAAAAALKGAVSQIVTFWWSSPALGETEYSRGDLLSSEATYLEKIGDAADAKAAWSRAADEYESEAALSRLAVPRAANFGRGEALMNAGRKAEARALYTRLAAAYPEEFTFNYDFARALKDDSDAASALPYARKASAVAYGDNWLRAVRLEAEILAALGRAPEALKLLDGALALPQAPGAEAVRTKRYLAALSGLRAKLRRPPAR
jgi:thiol-disulfide isomerase/thioredoxin